MTPHSTPPPNPDRSAGPQARLSLAAAVSPVVVLLAVVAGCGGVVWPYLGGPSGAIVAVWASPAVAILGAGLAFVGLRNIAGSGGEVVGRPMGIAGLFLGVAAAVLMGAGALASAAGLAGSARLAPEVARLTIAAGDGRFADARATLSASASSSLSDDQLRWFAGEARARLAAPVTGAAGGFDLLDGARDAISSAPNARTADIGPEEMPKPVWLRAGERRLIVYGWVDRDALAAREVEILDLLLVDREASEAVVLRPNGPANLLARKLGWTVVAAPPELAPNAAENAEADADR